MCKFFNATSFNLIIVTNLRFKFEPMSARNTTNTYLKINLNSTVDEFQNIKYKKLISLK